MPDLAVKTIGLSNLHDESGTMKEKYILYVDDDVDDRYVFRSIITEMNPALELVIVDHGQAALEFLDSLDTSQILPCFILLDINMPAMDGFATLREIKSKPELRDIPVILYTTSAHFKDLQQGDLFGAERVITKPFTSIEITGLAASFAAYCMALPPRRK
jgi:CheY-like chemotaxis protein